MNEMLNAEVAEERQGKNLNELSYLVIRCAKPSRPPRPLR